MDKAALDEINALEEQIIALTEKRSKLIQQSEAHEVENYTLDGWDGPVLLSELFGDKTDLIVIHNMGRSCTYCTLWADGFVGFTPHLENRAGFILVSPDSIETQKEFGGSRGWNFRMVSDGTQKQFSTAMGYCDADGDFLPGISTFSKDESGRIFRHRTAPFGPFDDYCSIWQMFGLLKDGVNNWEPKYKY